MFYALLLCLITAVAGFFGCSDKDTSPVATTAEVAPIGGYVPAGLRDWDLTKVVPLDSVRAMAQGQKMYVRTAFMGPEIDDFEVRFVGVLDDMMPPQPMILFEASDPRLVALGGVASGMSGSPLVTENGIVGALSYSSGAQMKAPYYFLATPIEAMLSGIFDGGVVPAAKLTKVKGRSFEPMALSIAGTGINRRFLDAITSRHQDRSLWQASDIGSANAADDVEQTFAPGSPLAVAVVTGDEVNLAGVGTLTYMAQDGRMVGFGHPMFDGVGEVGLPIIPARIMAEISYIEAPYKLATFGKRTLGSILFDRLPGIGGRLQVTPAMLPLKTTIHMPNGETLVFDHQIVRSGIPLSWQAGYGSYALLWPLITRLDSRPGYSLRVTTRMSFQGVDQKVESRRLYAASDYTPYDLGGGPIAEEYVNAYVSLTSHPDRLLSADWVDVTVDVIDSLLVGNVSRLEADTVAVAGSTLAVRVMLRAPQQMYSDRVEEFSLTLPDTLPPGIYRLTAGLEEPDPGLISGGYGLMKPVELMPDTSMYGDKSWDEILAEVNGEDKKTILTVTLSISDPDEPELPGTNVPPDSTVMDSTGYGLPDSLWPPRFPDFGDYNTPSDVTERRDVGVVVTGGRMREVRIVKPQ